MIHDFIRTIFVRTILSATILSRNLFGLAELFVAMRECNFGLKEVQVVFFNGIVFLHTLISNILMDAFRLG